MVKLITFRGSLSIALLSVMLPGSLRAQSVAETLQQLTTTVKSLEERSGGGSLPAGLDNMKNIYLGEGFASFSNVDGKRVGYVGENKEKNGNVGVYSRTGIEGVSVDVNEIGGFATFNDGAGKSTVLIGTDQGGQGALLINGNRKFDYAEVFDISSRSGIIPGSVVAAASDGTGIELASGPYDRLVVGVISGAGGLSSGVRTGTRNDGTTDLPVAVSGQVYVRVCDENGLIEVGDLLASSSRQGVAMRASSRVPGTIVGKALQPYKSASGAKEGLVRMLVMNQ